MVDDLRRRGESFIYDIGESSYRTSAVHNAEGNTVVTVTQLPDDYILWNAVYNGLFPLDKASRTARAVLVSYVIRSEPVSTPSEIDAATTVANNVIREMTDGVQHASKT